MVLKELSKCCTKVSMDCVFSSNVVFGSLPVESTTFVAVIVDDDADGDDEEDRPFWWL